MIKYFSLFLFFSLLTGGICAVGIKNVSPLPTARQKAKTVIAKPVAKDDFKAKYWVLSSLFRF